jgi:hypothetical protein
VEAHLVTPTAQDAALAVLLQRSIDGVNGFGMLPMAGGSMGLFFNERRGRRFGYPAPRTSRTRRSWARCRAEATPVFECRVVRMALLLVMRSSGGLRWGFDEGTAQRG